MSSMTDMIEDVPEDAGSGDENDNSAGVTVDSGVATARWHHNTGAMRQIDTPRWDPLEDLLRSDALCAQFMWMHDAELDDGTIVNAYKHRCTRRYIYLADDGRTFVYAYDHGYEAECYWPTAPYLALAVAFEHWESCDPTPEEDTALRSALRRALGDQ